ncbi:MAG: aminotransferase class III-fold pyridoxal phosphate-dependent enzyme [Acidimicrobiales bacterium]
MGSAVVEWDVLSRSEAPHLLTEIPGPNARVAVERDRAVTSPSLPRAYPIVVGRAAGSVIEDVDDNRFLDLNAGIAVCSTGHSHPKVVAAIEEQARSYLHYCGSDFYLPVYTEMCERLAALAPMRGPNRVFLANSGTEAVEAALKLARLHTGRQNIVSFLGSFHGRTLGSVSITGSKAKYRSKFAPLVPGVYFTPYATCGHCPINLEYPSCALACAHEIERVLFRHLVEPDDVAAVIVEPVQGEGGYVVPPAGWMAALRAICDEHGILLIADEVQSGMGRTGRLWAIEHDGVEPDIVVAGKGIASGLPLGAVIARAELMSWHAGHHGSTFGGNPVSCAAALTTLDVILEGGLLENAAARGVEFRDAFSALAASRPSVITDVRGRGLMIGVEFATGDLAYAFEQRCFERGVLVLTCGERTVRISPALTITAQQVADAMRAIAPVVGAL